MTTTTTTSTLTTMTMMAKENNGRDNGHKKQSTAVMEIVHGAEYT
jgi:hypothetical protein